MPRKNDHRVWVGPTDARGRVTVTRDSLFAEARKDTQFFVMDYLDPAEASGEFVVTAVTSEDLDRAISGYQEFKEYFPFRGGWLDQIIAARGVMQSASGATATVERPTNPVV